MTHYTLLDIVSQIKESADEVKKEERNDLNFGKLLAYAEALSIIRDVYSGDLAKIGLDFDVDKRYLL